MKVLRLEALQEQPVGVLTKIVPVAAASEMLTLAGLIEKVQADGAGGAACRTVKIFPATVALPLRKLPVFAATSKATDPDPVPPLPLGNVRNPIVLAALHAQPVCVVTEIVPLVDILFIQFRSSTETCRRRRSSLRAGIACAWIC